MQLVSKCIYIVDVVVNKLKVYMSEKSYAVVCLTV